MLLRLVQKCCNPLECEGVASWLASKQDYASRLIKLNVQFPLLSFLAKYCWHHKFYRNGGTWDEMCKQEKNSVHMKQGEFPKPPKYFEMQARQRRVKIL